MNKLKGVEITDLLTCGTSLDTGLACFNKVVTFGTGDTDWRANMDITHGDHIWVLGDTC